jgi:hypothetical protein
MEIIKGELMFCNSNTSAQVGLGEGPIIPMSDKKMVF